MGFEPVCTCSRQVDILLNMVLYISYPCKNDIQQNVCEKPAVSHKAIGQVPYTWLKADIGHILFSQQG